MATLRSFDAYRAATPEQLERLGRRKPEIARLVEASNPAVLAALFVDDDVLSWQVAYYSSHPNHQGLSLIYPNDLAGQRARREALKAALRALGQLPDG